MTAVTDDFSTDTSLNWTGRNGSGWAITGGVLTGPTVVSQDQFGCYLYTADPTVGVNQYAKITVTSNVNFGGVCLRHNNSDNGTYYAIAFAKDAAGGPKLIIESYVNGVYDERHLTDISLPWANGDILAASVRGTSATQIDFEIWRNPTGDTPAEWGGSPNLTATQTSGTSIDTGTYVGVIQFLASASGQYDNFTGGDYTTVYIAATSGDYAITGADATLKLTGAFDLVADSGVYAITGAVADLESFEKNTLSADTGVYAITGTPAETIYTTIVKGTSGVYAYTGTDADPISSISTGLSIAADPGAFIVSGKSAVFAYRDRSLTLTSSSGSYSVLGDDITGVYSNVGADGYTDISDQSSAWTSVSGSNPRWNTIDNGEYLLIDSSGDNLLIDSSGNSLLIDEPDENITIWTDANG